MNLMSKHIIGLFVISANFGHLPQLAVSQQSRLKLKWQLNVYSLSWLHYSLITECGFNSTLSSAFSFPSAPPALPSHRLRLPALGTQTVKPANAVAVLGRPILTRLAIVNFLLISRIATLHFNHLVLHFSTRFHLLLHNMFIDLLHLLLLLLLLL